MGMGGLTVGLFFCFSLVPGFSCSIVLTFLLSRQRVRPAYDAEVNTSHSLSPPPHEHPPSQVAVAVAVGGSISNQCQLMHHPDHRHQSLQKQDFQQDLTNGIIWARTIHRCCSAKESGGERRAGQSLFTTSFPLTSLTYQVYEGWRGGKSGQKLSEKIGMNLWTLVFSGG